MKSRLIWGAVFIILFILIYRIFPPAFYLKAKIPIALCFLIIFGFFYLKAIPVAGTYKNLRNDEKRTRFAGFMSVLLMLPLIIAVALLINHLGEPAVNLSSQQENVQNEEAPGIYEDTVEVIR